MNSELTFRVIIATLCILLPPMRIYYALRYRYYTRKAQPSGEKISFRERLKEAAEREGKLTMMLRFIFGSFYVAAVILYLILPQWLAWFTLPLPMWLRWVGAGLGFVSVPLMFWVFHTLGKYWSPELELREQHKLVTSGPYRWVRHPMYSVGFALFSGLFLMSSNWLIVLSGVATIIMIYARIGREETMMIELFGNEYSDYMKRTGRLLPRLIRKAD